MEWVRGRAAQDTATGAPMVEAESGREAMDGPARTGAQGGGLQEERGGKVPSERPQPRPPRARREGWRDRAEARIPQG